MSVISVANVLVCILLWVLWKVFQRVLLEIPLDNVPGPPSNSAWTGNLGRMFHRHKGWDFDTELGNGPNTVVKVHGLLNTPLLYTFDPKALQSILVKDQNIWEETPSFIMSNLLLFGPGLMSTQGKMHKKQRKVINPVFSTSHMRFMTPIFYRVTHKLKEAINNELKDGPKEVDLLDWMSRTALELIGQGGLGHSFDPLVEEVSNTFRSALKSLVPALFSLAVFRTMLPVLVKIGPANFRRRLVDILPIPSLQKLKDVTYIMDAQSKVILNAKKAALSEGEEAVVQQVGEGKDIMSILLKANMTANAEDKLPEQELIGQMSTLVFAAMDTTSNALSHIIHLLAKHQHVQDKLREEVTSAGDGQDIPYDQLMDLPYLDAICRETLRLYPPVTIITRNARDNIIMPLSSPIRGVDGKLMNEIPVPKGTNVCVAIRASNRNKALWGSDANEWKPERWLSPLPASLTDARLPGVYSNLMTFGGGGRSCIGFKFSQLEMKVVLSVLLATFKFSPANAEIVWNLGNIKYPTVGHKSKESKLPMYVERIQV